VRVPFATVAVLVLPLACWLLAARTPRARGRVLVVLACSAVIEIALVEGWIFPGQKYTLLASFLIVTSATLVAGIGVEKARRDLPPFRRAGPRVLAGALLSGAWATLAVALIVFFIFGELAFGEPVGTPSADTVLPMPANFYVIANVDRGCGTTVGPQMICIREIDLQGSGPASTAAIVDSLTGVYGWHLTRAPDYSWNGCRTVGSFLDAHTVCAVVQSRPSADVVTLEAAGDW
jgi:hypothetical protein